MSENMTNVYFLPIEMNGSNQAIFVTTNIEHNQSSNQVGTCKESVKLVERSETVFFDNPKLDI